MDYVKAAINACYKFFSGAPRVDAAIEHAKTLVAEDKLDEAIAYLRGIEATYRSDSTGGIIADYLDPLIDEKTAEVRGLMREAKYEEVRSLFVKAPCFYGQMSDVLSFLNPPAKAGAGASH